MTEPAVATPIWTIRLLGAAAGAVASMALALLTFVTIVGLLVGLVGVPVGAIVGAVLGPWVVSGRHQGLALLAAAAVATVLGTAAYALVAAIGQGAGASLADLLSYAADMAGLVVGVGLTFGAVMAIVAAVIAAAILRRALPRAERFVLPAGLVVALVAIATLAVVADVAADAGNAAALSGDRISVEYVVRSAYHPSPDEPGPLLEIRDYWRGELQWGGSAAVDECSSGSEPLQSEWAMWLGRDDGEWDARPAGPPLVTSHDAGNGATRITIRIAANGSATWEPGLDRAGC